MSKDHNESSALSLKYPEEMCALKKIYEKWYASTGADETGSKSVKINL